MDWSVMLKAYLITISIETPILLVGLSPRHSYARRLICGVWLTACTYPILWLVLPVFIDWREQRGLYLAVGETFVPIAECAIFWAAFGRYDDKDLRLLHATEPVQGKQPEPKVDRTEKEPISLPSAITLEPASVASSNETPPEISSACSIPRRRRLWMWRDLITITVANLASFGIGEWLNRMEWFVQWLTGREAAGPPG